MFKFLLSLSKTCFQRKAFKILFKNTPTKLVHGAVYKTGKGEFCIYDIPKKEQKGIRFGPMGSANSVPIGRQLLALEFENYKSVEAMISVLKELSEGMQKRRPLEKIIDSLLSSVWVETIPVPDPSFQYPPIEDMQKEEKQKGDPK